MGLFHLIANFFRQLWYFLLGRVLRIKGYRPVKEEDLRSKIHHGSHPGPTYKAYDDTKEKDLQQLEQDRLDEKKGKYGEVERINEEKTEHDAPRIVGFAKIVGAWTKYVIEEKMAAMGLQEGEVPEDVKADGQKPRGYWSTLVWLTQSKENERKWREMIESSKRNNKGGDRGL